MAMEEKALNDIPGTERMYTADECDSKFLGKEAGVDSIQDVDNNIIHANGRLIVSKDIKYDLFTLEIPDAHIEGVDRYTDIKVMSTQSSKTSSTVKVSGKYEGDTLESITMSFSLVYDQAEGLKIRVNGDYNDFTADVFGPPYLSDSVLVFGKHGTPMASVQFNTIQESRETGSHIIATRDDIADWARAGKEPPSPGGHHDYIEDAAGNKISADRSAVEGVTLDTPWTYSYNGITKTADEFRTTGAALVWGTPGSTDGGWRIESFSDIRVSIDPQDTDVTYEFPNTGPYIEGTEPGVPVTVHATRVVGGGKLALQSDIADWARADQPKPSSGGHSVTTECDDVVNALFEYDVVYSNGVIEHDGVSRGSTKTHTDVAYIFGSTANGKLTVKKGTSSYIVQNEDGYYHQFSFPVLVDGLTLLGYSSTPCFAKGTMITLADWSEKPCEEITYDDDLLVWDFDVGRWSHAKPIWVKRAQTTDFHWHDEFSDGRTLDTVGPHGHRVLNLEEGRWMYDTECHRRSVKTMDGTAILERCTKVYGETEFYNIITDRHINLVANGILTSSSRNNLYPISDMKFVKRPVAVRTEDEFFWPSEKARKFFLGCRLYETSDSVEEVNRFIMQKWMTDVENEEV